MKKKVLLVVTKSNFGGAQRYVYDLATNLPTDEFDIAVAFGPGLDGRPGRLAKMLSEKGVRTILVLELGRDINPIGDLRALRALITLFKKEQPHVVHLNSSKAGGLGAFAARLAGVPRIIFTSHGLAFDEKRGALQRLLIWLATWTTILLTHTTIAVSVETFERIRHMPFLRKKVRLVHNGIITPTFISKQDARTEIMTLDPNLPHEGHWIGSIGELHRNKDYATAIDALTYMESDAHLVVIGEGEARESLLARAVENNVQDRVHLVGFVSDAAKYLRAFDTFILPSQKEGLPYVLLEAGYGYLPVVATDIPGVRDVILPDFTGLIVPPGDAQALSNAIERTLTDARLSRSLADELLKRIQKSFALDTMIEKTSLLYSDHA